MDIRRLEQLLVVARCGNLSEAARLLRITPGGLSKSMDVLESDLGGSPLFVRDGRNIQLTDYARDVVQKAPAVIASVAELGSGRRKKQADEGNILRIGAFEVFSTYFMGEYFSSYAPAGCALLAREFVPGQMEEAIATSVVDVGLTYHPVPAQGVEHLKIARCTSAIFGLKSLFGGKNLSALPFAGPAIPISGSPTGVRGLDSWKDDKFERNMLYKVDVMETALELTRMGKSVIFAPRFLIGLHNAKYVKEHQLSELTPPDLKGKKPFTVTREIFLVKRKSTTESPLIRNLARAVREVCADR